MQSLGGGNPIRIAARIFDLNSMTGDTSTAIGGLRSFFPTPPAISAKLVHLIWEASTFDKTRLLRVADFCAGEGELLGAFLGSNRFTIGSASVIDIDGDLLSAACVRLRDYPSIKFSLVDATSDEISSILAETDVVLCNPPYKGYRKCNEGERKAIKTWGLPPYNDLACAFVLHLITKASPGTILGFVLRTDMVAGWGYRDFRAQIEELSAVLAVDHLASRVMSQHGSTRCSLLAVRRHDCWKEVSQNGQIRRPDFIVPEYSRIARLLDGGWIRLGLVADVVSGPNTGDDARYINRGGRSRVIRLQRSSEQDRLWDDDRLESIEWDASRFLARRNLKQQGRPGLAYRLAGAAFVCSILPTNTFFLSRSPAILPRVLSNLDLVTGCGLLGTWRRLVRSIVKSTNFTPGAVAEVPIPCLDSEIGKRAQAAGKLARRHITNRLAGSGDHDLTELNEILCDCADLAAELIEDSVDQRTLRW